MSNPQKIRTMMAFFLYTAVRAEELGRRKVSEWARRQYRKYRLFLIHSWIPLPDRRDDIDRLGLYFRTLRVRLRRGITFEEFVRQVQAGAWTP